MSTILIEHAKRVVWCEPIQDSQYTIELARLTKDGGVLSGQTIDGHYVPTPQNNTPVGRPFYHMYQIGQIPPDTFSVDMEDRVWYNLVEFIPNNDVVIDVFYNNGAVVPKLYCWLYRTLRQNLILAVAQVPNTDYGTQWIDSDFVGNPIRRPLDRNNAALYIRFYNNARFSSLDWTAQATNPEIPLAVVTRYITNITDYTTFMATVATITASYGASGKGLFYADGFLTAQPIGYQTAYVGKMMSFIWDASIKNIQTLALTDLPTFNSVVDLNQPKHVYLSNTTPTMIDYHDDVDFYLVSGTGLNYKGVYLNRFTADPVRQLLPNGYSLSAQALMSLRAHHPFLNNAASVFVVAVVREGGMVRGLDHQHNRIEELRQLNRVDQLGALSGVPATLPEWRADVLEDSAYVRLMGAKLQDITTQLVCDAYGYNTATRVAARPDAVVAAGQITVPPALLLPEYPLLTGRRTVYAYDNTGRLQGYINDQQTSDVLLVTAARAEVFNYLTSETTTGIVFDQDVANHNLKQYGFRAYACVLINGVPNEEWVDVTDSVYYTYHPSGDINSNGVPVVRWNYGLLNGANLFPALKINTTAHLHTVNGLSDTYPGYIRFSVNHTTNWFGTTVTRPQTLPPGDVVVYMGDVGGLDTLIEGVDYYMNWPEITIVRVPSVPMQDLVVKVRSYGFANPDTLKPFAARETGFARGGILSVNGVYDVRNDRNIRICVGGMYKQRDQVTFAEGLQDELVTDGRPYCISDYIIPVESYTPKDTLSWRQESFEVDERVSDYLTVKNLPQQTPMPFIVDQQWQVFSPFCSALIHAFLEGNYLDAGELDQPYDNLDVSGWVSPFVSLLAYDPCVLGYDANYVLVNAHQYAAPVTLSQKQYAFLEYVIRHYLNNQVDLTPSVTIGV